MKKDLLKVKLLRDHMIGLRMELDLVINDLSVVNTDLEYLEKIEQDLVTNIIILKKEKVIAIASQYKKSLLELESVRKNISHYRNTKLQLDRKYEIKSKSYQRIFEDYEHRRKIMERSKVILLFDQKKRRKKK